MISKLPWLFLLISSITFAQIPTNGLIAQYDFDSGALLTDNINANDFTQTGSALTQVVDRFGTTPTSAIMLNGDHLERPNINTGSSYSYSFWIKTDVNSSTRQMIINDSNLTPTNASTSIGTRTYLVNGGLQTVVRHRINNAGTISYASAIEVSSFIADDCWHHIAIRMESRTYSATQNNIGGTLTSIRMFIDGVTTRVIENQIGGTTLDASSDVTGHVTVANDRNNTLPAAERFQGSLDEILIYDRLLLSNEVQDIFENQNYCGVPLASNLTASSVTGSSATININNPGTFDIAYHKASEPFSSATTVTGISSGSTILSGLDFFTDYMVYSREQCAITTKWSETPMTFTTVGSARIFVDRDAVAGNNNGLDWANAYTDLQDALAAAQNGNEIWIADGVYHPHATDRNTSYIVNRSNLGIYGGFNGTETQLSDRVLGAYETILSGDLQDNDVNQSSFSDNYSNTTRNADNSYRVLVAVSTANNLLLDGLTISDAHNNEGSLSGGAIVKSTAISNFTIRNCIVKDNVCRNSNAGLSVEFNLPYANPNGNLKVENCQFINNMSRLGSGIYFIVRGFSNINANIVNTLFEGNIAADLGTVQGYAGSSCWVRHLGVSGTFPSSNINFINNTLVGNIDAGTAASIDNSRRSTLGISKQSSGLNVNVQATVANTIFWGNTSGGGAVGKSISQIHEVATGSINVFNSIDENDFVAGNLIKTNTSDSDPLFRDPVNGDYKMQISSPALNTGDNSKIPPGITKDLEGNDRIQNGDVDLGVYEQTCTSSCYTLTLNIIGNGVVENNGLLLNTVSYFDQNTTLSLMANPGVNHQFTNWDGDATGNANPLMLVMDSDKTITVNFIGLIFVDKDATGANDGSSWGDAFTDLQTALTVVNSNAISIWVAEGVYTPPVSNRGNSFNVDSDNLKIYGGFNATETTLTDRDLSLIHSTNATILSGDLQGNDSGTSTFTNSSLSENSYRVVNVQSDNVLIDGVIISSGNANGSGDDRFGSGLGVQTGVNAFTIRNSIFRDNVSVLGALYLRSSSTSGLHYNIESCIFENNLSSNVAAGIYAFPEADTNMNITITNSLFDNNRTANNGSNLANGLSTVWIRSYFSGSTITPTIVNNTFVNNKNEGTGNSDFATFGLSRVSGAFNNPTIANNIFWGNTNNTGNTALAFGVRTDTNIFSSITVHNSIDENNFSNIPNTNNSSNSNPLFADAANGDFTLQSGSPGIDAGDNSLIPSGITTDLAGNNRIEDGTVDMGCYERLGLQINLSPQVFLQGPLLNPTTAGLMNDNLRVNGYLQTTSPYSDNLTCNASVFNTTGNDAIVDWIWIELRDKNDNKSVLYSTSALLQRDGDVVGVDGVSNLNFSASADAYYVAINHRSHLGIMSLNAINLSSTVTTVNFKDANSQITYGTDAQTTFGIASGLVAMWSGDVNGDNIIQYSGTSSDTPSLLTEVLNDPGNFLNLTTYKINGYSNYDVDMNGETQYNGSSSDTPFILQNILAHPGNFLNFNTYIINAQMP